MAKQPSAIARLTPAKGTPAFLVIVERRSFGLSPAANEWKDPMVDRVVHAIELPTKIGEFIVYQASDLKNVSKIVTVCSVVQEGSMVSDPPTRPNLEELNQLVQWGNFRIYTLGATGAPQRGLAEELDAPPNGGRVLKR